MGAAEKLTQYFTPNTRSTANDELTGDKRVLVRYYKNVHLQRFQISPSQVKPAMPQSGERDLENDVWLSPDIAQQAVNSGAAMFVRDKPGNVITEE